MSPASEEQASPQNRRRSVLTIIVSYVLFTLGWILLSDYLLDSAGLPPEQIFWFSVAKGLVYIVLSSLLLYFLVQRSLDKATTLPEIKFSKVNHSRIYGCCY